MTVLKWKQASKIESTIMTATGIMYSHVPVMSTRSYDPYLKLYMGVAGTFQ